MPGPRVAPRSPRRPRPGLSPFLLSLAAAVLAALPLSSPAAAQLDSAQVRGVEWRNIGPFRGGRSVAVAGVAGDPLTFYMGSTGGGVWKTTDGGQTWRNVSDGYLNTASVGALAVAPSDPNVVWLGMGEHPVRGVTTSHGDGVYRSTDAGRTWSRLGLDDTRAIARIRVHPENPDVAWVAAQGAPYGPSEARGVYRTTDGGDSWEKVLYVSEDAGASELALDPTNPRILYAALWDHRRLPWFVRSGGPGSGIWKSTDGGDTWTRLTEGLPGEMGKIGVTVSAADPDRLWAVVEAADDEGGVYRSDDAGASWSQTTDDRVVQTRSWYYMEIFAHPTDPHTVFVLNAPLLRSVDGGRTFEEIEVGHGDTHDLWIDPAEPERMILGDDGGAEITTNGGETWSTLYNQPTAQFYRVSVDRQFPYHVYGGQQDNSAIGIRSAARGGIGADDYYSVAGCESAYLAFDPDAPTEVFGGCYQGLIDRWDRETGLSKPVMAYPYLGLGTVPREQRYRFNWNAPIVADPFDPDVIYHAGNVVLVTRDRGQSWEEISPDLTRDEEERQGPGGGPITNEGAGGEIYNTIFYVEPSPVARGMLWVGTDDGLVHVTRNGGADWTDVTPPGVEDGTLINSIEASPHDAERAYVVATRYKLNDFTPMIFRTDDGGASWEPAASGIAPGHWVRVVREDPVRPGLLYAGTEGGLYRSKDGAASWSALQLNLPLVPITDLTFADAGRDLVAATQGRAFWILDHADVLRQLDGGVFAEPVTLLRPADVHRVGWFGGFDVEARTGANPPTGAPIFFAFAEAPDTLVTLEIVDGGGRVVRTYATDPEAAGDEDFTELEAPEAGLNRIDWNFRGEGITEVEGLVPFGSTDGFLQAPGRYNVRLTAGDRTAEAPLTVLPDPRWDATPAQYAGQQTFLQRARALADGIYRSVEWMRSVREQVEAAAERAEETPAEDTVRAAADSLIAALEAWEEPLVQPRQQTFQDVINFLNRLDAQVLALIGSVDGTEPPVTAGAAGRLDDLEAAWRPHRAAMEALLSDQVAAFERLLDDEGVGAIRR